MRQMTFSGFFEESEAHERNWRLREQRLTAALEASGIRTGTVAWIIAMMIHTVPKNNGQAFRKKNAEIATDRYLVQLVGRPISEHTVTKAIRRLRDLGIVVHREHIDRGCEYAIREIDHAAVLRICERAGIEVESPMCDPHSAPHLASQGAPHSASHFAPHISGTLDTSITPDTPKNQKPNNPRTVGRSNTRFTRPVVATERGRKKSETGGEEGVKERPVPPSVGDVDVRRVTLDLQVACTHWKPVLSRVDRQIIDRIAQGVASRDYEPDEVPEAIRQANAWIRERAMAGETINQPVSLLERIIDRLADERVCR